MVCDWWISIRFVVPVFQGLLFVTVINNNNTNIIIIMIDYSKKCVKAAYELRVHVFWKAQWSILVLTIYYLTAKHNYQNTWLREIHYLLNFCATCPFKF